MFFLGFVVGGDLGLLLVCLFVNVVLCVLWVVCGAWFGRVWFGLVWVGWVWWVVGFVLVLVLGCYGLFSLVVGVVGVVFVWVWFA